MAYNKYRNKKTTIDGITFDSKKEASRYSELMLMIKAGVIHDLKMQPKFELCGPVLWNGKKLRARSYKADFQYLDMDTGEEIVEDVKGHLTDVYKLKRSIFLTLYPQYKFIET